MHSTRRAIIYTTNGDPSKVLSVRTLPEIPPPSADQVQLKIRLAPINPADINVIEGVYPEKPSPRDDLGISESAYIGGNEGLAEVVSTGSDVSELKIGDWVVMAKPQSGTWTSKINSRPQDLIKVPKSISEVSAATISVNPTSAFVMLRYFVSLNPGDFVIQNGANSTVGQAVIQIAAVLGLSTINLVRDRPDIEALKRYLKELGNDDTRILTYDELADRSAREAVKSWTNGKSISLGLNGIAGKETSLMAKFLGPDAHLVTYGAMSKTPLSLSTSLFIFKNLTAHGFWMAKWFERNGRSTRETIIKELVSMIEKGQLKEPMHEIVTLRGTDDEITSPMRNIIQRITAGGYGKKVLLRWE